MGKGILRVAGLVWAETVMEGVFFIMQTYFTDVWKLGYTNAATILNIWGGLYRIFPFFSLFLADTLLGNFATLALSGISSTAGIVLITVATTPVFGHVVSGGRCQDKDDTECVTQTEKLLLIMGLALIAVGRGARFASTEPFILDQNDEDEEDKTSMKDCNLGTWWVTICLVVFFFTPVTVIIAFPYIKKWYVLFGVSACFTIFATLFYLTGACSYNITKPKPEGSPVTDSVRVLVAAAFKIFQPFPEGDDTQLHRIQGEEFQSLSSTRMLGFLHKAAVIVPGDRRGDGEVKKRSWRISSVSQVESAKVVMRLIPIMSSFIICGLVSSIGNTYFIEQASHMNSKIGKWEPPLQLLLLVFTLGKYMTMSSLAPIKMLLGKYGAIPSGVFANVYCVVCCAVAASVERRRVHVLMRHDLLDLPDDGQVPMSAAWLYFQIGFLGAVEICSEYGLWAFLESGLPESMKRYKDCLVDGVTGLGFICGALSVYVVGEVSKAGGGNNWFQFTLNKSRLDRYYWVLTALSSLNFIAFIILLCIYRPKTDEDDDEDGGEDFVSEICCVRKGSALELVVRSKC